MLAGWTGRRHITRHPRATAVVMIFGLVGMLLTDPAVVAFAAGQGRVVTAVPLAGGAPAPLLSRNQGYRPLRDGDNVSVFCHVFGSDARSIRAVLRKVAQRLSGSNVAFLTGMRRVPALVLLLSFFAVAMSEAAPGRSNEQQNQAGGRGRGRGQIGSEPVSVAEPSSLILLGAGSVAVAWWVRRRRSGRH
jgi:hypothetical protein